jgi:ribosomal protein L7/L12
MDSFWVIALVVGLPLIVVVWQLASVKPDPTVTRRLAAVERKLDLVMDQLDIAEPPPAMPDVVRALEHGNKIAAIKAYRDATGTDLAAAKNAVDDMAAQRGL